MSYKKFVKDIGIYGLTQLAAALSGIVILPTITKLLGAQKYGTWTQLLVTIGLLSSIALLGLPFTLVRFLAGEKDKRKIQDGIWSVTTLILAVSVLMSGLLILFANPISQFFHCDKIFIQILAFIIIFEYVNPVFFNVFRAFQQNIRLCFFVVFQKLGETGLIILAIFLGYGLLGAMIASLIIRIITLILTGFLVIKDVGFRLPQFLQIKEYLAFGLPTIPDNLSGWIVHSSDRYFIGSFLGAAAVGYYSSAYTLGAFVITFLVSPFSFLLPSILSKFYDENKINDVKIYLKYSLKYFLLLAIPSVFGLAGLSKQILTIFTTPEFAQAGYLTMPIIALAMVPMGANAIIAQIVGITKKTKIGGTFATVSALINVGLNFVFIPLFGIMGAALTTLIAFTFLFLSTGIYSSYHIAFEIDWPFIAKSLAASIAMVIVVIWLAPLGLYQTLNAIFWGIIVYAIGIILLKGFSQKEIDLFKQFSKRA